MCAENFCRGFPKELCANSLGWEDTWKVEKRIGRDCSKERGRASRAASVRAGDRWAPEADSRCRGCKGKGDRGIEEGIFYWAARGWRWCPAWRALRWTQPQVGNNLHLGQDAYLFNMRTLWLAQGPWRANGAWSRQWVDHSHRASHSNVPDRRWHF